MRFAVVFALALCFGSLRAQEREILSDSVVLEQSLTNALESLKAKLEDPGLSDSERRKLRRKERHWERALDPLTPSKAAFYSAVLPGLGQIYNRSYWKLPLVYGALGTGLYFYIDNTNEYHRYRDAYKRRLAGFQDDEFYDINNSGIIPNSPDVSDEALRDAQEFYQRNRDLSLLITIGLYALNIIDANVDAHLKQFNVNQDLSIRPMLEADPLQYHSQVGLSLNFKF